MKKYYELDGIKYNIIDMNSKHFTIKKDNFTIYISNNYLYLNIGDCVVVWRCNKKYNVVIDSYFIDGCFLVYRDTFMERIISNMIDKTFLKSHIRKCKIKEILE